MSYKFLLLAIAGMRVSHFLALLARLSVSSLSPSVRVRLVCVGSMVSPPPGSRIREALRRRILNFREHRRVVALQQLTRYREAWDRVGIFAQGEGHGCRWAIVEMYQFYLWCLWRWRPWAAWECYSQCCTSTMKVFDYISGRWVFVVHIVCVDGQVRICMISDTVESQPSAAQTLYEI